MLLSPSMKITIYLKVHALKVHALKPHKHALEHSSLNPIGGVAWPIFAVYHPRGRGRGQNLPLGARSWLRHFGLPLWQRELHLRFSLTHAGLMICHRHRRVDDLICFVDDLLFCSAARTLGRSEHGGLHACRFYFPLEHIVFSKGFGVWRQRSSLPVWEERRGCRVNSTREARSF